MYRSPLLLALLALCPMLPAESSRKSTTPAYTAASVFTEGDPEGSVPRRPGGATLQKDPRRRGGKGGGLWAPAWGEPGPAVVVGQINMLAAQMLPLGDLRFLVGGKTLDSASTAY